MKKLLHYKRYSVISLIGIMLLACDAVTSVQQFATEPPPTAVKPTAIAFPTFPPQWTPTAIAPTATTAPIVIVSTATHLKAITSSPAPTLLVSTSQVKSAGQIFFVSESATARSIFKINSDGSGLTLLLPNLDKQSNFLISPDKTRVLNVVKTASSPVRFVMYVINIDGSNKIQLMGEQAEIYPAWSPDSKHIAFTAGTIGVRVFYIVNADGSKQTVIETPKDASAPTWSPDGTRIVYSATGQVTEGGTTYSAAEIYVMNADGSGNKRLTQNKYIDSNSAWSPDGKRIAFTSSRDRPELYVMNADGSNQISLAKGVKQFAWSPDGKQIALAISPSQSASADIYVINSDNGTGVKQLTNFATDENSPVWSPDGKWIAFNTDRNKTYDIYIINPDGTNLTAVIKSSQQDLMMTWLP